MNYDPEDNGEPWIPDEDYSGSNDDDPIDDGYNDDGGIDDDALDAEYNG